MKRLTLAILTLTVLMSSSLVFARDDENKAIAKFIYGLPKFVGDKKGNLCAYGYDQTIAEFKENFKDITFLKNDDDLSAGRLAQKNCSVVYVGMNRYTSIKYLSNSRVVSVGTDESFISKGGMMVVQMGRRSFELIVNYGAIKELQIKFDPLIEGLIVN